MQDLIRVTQKDKFDLFVCLIIYTYVYMCVIYMYIYIYISHTQF